MGRPSSCPTCRSLTEALDTAHDALCALDADLEEGGEPSTSLRRRFITHKLQTLIEALNQSPHQAHGRLIICRKDCPAA